MRTLAEVINQLAYHPATEETAKTHDALRKCYANHAMDIWSLIPEGPEKTTALRKLQESLMYANLAVALKALIDTSTSDVARVLPTTADLDRRDAR